MSINLHFSQIDGVLDKCLSVHLTTIHSLTLQLEKIEYALTWPKSHRAVANFR